MIKDINHITLSGETFPIRLDNLVLQKIQEKFGNIEAFEFSMMGWEKAEDGVKIVSEPSLAVLNWLLPELIKEGCACEGIECDYSDDDLIRLVDINPLRLALTLHEEVSRCFDRKKKENPQREQKRQRNLTEKSTFFGFITSVLRN